MDAATTLSKNRQIPLMTAICLGAFTSHFTAGVVNVSLPHLSDLFGTNLNIIQWITIGYLLVIAALLPIMGSLGDRVGHRFIHNLGYIIFTISSLLVAISSNLFMLLVLRVIQAIGAAMFQATNIALISIHIPKENRGHALGLISTVVALGAMTGPIAGGFIAEWFSWEWLFLCHVPIMLLASILAIRFIPFHNKKQVKKSFDIIGMLLFCGGVISFIFGITFMNTWGVISAKTILVMIVSLISILLFWLWESHHTSPFLSVQLFRSPTVLFGLIISINTFLLANIALVVMPFYLSHVKHLSPAKAGYVIIAYPAVLAAVGTLAGRLSDRYGSTPFMMVGLCSILLGFLSGLFILHSSSIIGVIIVLAFIGLGMGLIASPNNRIIIEHTPKKLVGTVGGMIALTRNLGMVLGASIGLSFLDYSIISTGTFRPIFVFGLCLSLASMLVLRLSFGKNPIN